MFSPISNAKFSGREIFSKISVRNPLQSHALQHVDARHNCSGPLRVVSNLRTTRRYGFWCDLTRFRTKKSFAAAKNSKFSVENRAESHAPQHADARHSCLGTFKGYEQAAHHQAARILGRSHAISNAKFCGREKFSKISVRNPLQIARILPCRSIQTLNVVLMDL